MQFKTVEEFGSYDSMEELDFPFDCCVGFSRKVLNGCMLLYSHLSGLLLLPYH